MVRTYRRRRTGLRKSASLRKRRYVRRARRVSRPMSRAIVRAIKPEVKSVVTVLGFGVGGNPATTFATAFPNTWNSVDCSPGQGVAMNQRVGNEYTSIGYKFDVYFDCLDRDVDWAFLCFRWKQVEGPDAATWPNPLSGSGATQGQMVNPFFAPPKNQWFQTLKYINARTYIANTGISGAESQSYRRRIKFFLKPKMRVRTVDAQTVYPGSMSSGTSSNQTSFKNRIYFMFITNNILGADCRIWGNYVHYFTDS